MVVGASLSGSPEVMPTSSNVSEDPLDASIDLETLERQRGLLPPVPDILVRLESILKTGDATAPQVSEMIASEVSIVARILRMANSAYYSLPRPVSDLTYAIAFLGFAEIHRIVLTACVADAFQGTEPARVRRFWFHSYYTALIAKHLSGVFERHLEPGVLWSSALLHDVGELIYMQLFPKPYEALMNYREEDRCLFEEAEAAICVASHRQLGAMLCDYWRLPDPIKDVCLHHGRLDPAAAGPTKELASVRRLVTVGDHLSSLVAEPLREDVQQGLKSAVRSLLACSERDLGVILTKVKRLRSEVDRFSCEQR